MYLSCITMESSYRLKRCTSARFTSLADVDGGVDKAWITSGSMKLLEGLAGWSDVVVAFEDRNHLPEQCISRMRVSDLELSFAFGLGGGINGTAG